jgi:hypothetical protein
MLFRLQTIILAGGFLAEVCIAESQFLYYSGDRLVKTNGTQPVRFHGNPIGTIELAEVAESGAIQLMSEGHHFGQYDWVLTAQNNGSWEYRPGRKEKRGNVALQQRQTGSALFEYSGNFLTGLLFASTFPLSSTMSSGNVNLGGEADVMDWFWSDSAGGDVDFTLNDIFVTAIDAVSDSVEDIFFDALTLFFL